MKKIPENSATSTSVLGLNLSPETRKFITWVWLSIWLLLGWNWWYKNEAQAQFSTSMNTSNSIALSTMTNIIIWSTFDNSSPSEYKKNIASTILKVYESLQKEKLWLSEEKLKEVNKLFIEHLVKIYNSKEQENGLLSMWELLEIGKKSWITELQTLQIVKIYIKNNLIPENISRDVLYSVISFYNQETFLLKMTQVENLYKDWKEISQDSIYPIFKEYFDAKLEKESEQRKMALAVILWAFLLAWIVEVWRLYLTREDKKTWK